jgi:hypothetical protein
MKTLTICIVFMVLFNISAFAYTISSTKTIYSPMNATAGGCVKAPNSKGTMIITCIPTNKGINQPTTTTTLKQTYTLTAQQVGDFNAQRSRLESWAAQGGYDECKRDTRATFNLPGAKTATLPGIYGPSLQCFRDKGGYIEIDGSLFELRVLDEKNNTYAPINTSRIRIYPKNMTRFLGNGMW